MTTHHLPEGFDARDWTYFAEGTAAIAYRATFAHHWLVVPFASRKRSEPIWCNSLLFVLCLIHGEACPHYGFPVEQPPDPVPALRALALPAPLAEPAMRPGTPVQLALF